MSTAWDGEFESSENDEYINGYIYMSDVNLDEIRIVFEGKYCRDEMYKTTINGKKISLGKTEITFTITSKTENTIEGNYVAQNPADNGTFWLDRCVTIQESRLCALL